MSVHPSSTVEESRKALAKRLREIRLDAGLTSRDVAHRASWHPSKSSRLENGVTLPSDADLRAWCNVCGASDQADDLIAAARSTSSMYVEWRRIHRAGLRRGQEAMVPLFDRTKVFKVYSSNVVPGLFQTEAYALALLDDIAQFRQVPNDSPDAARARVERSSRTMQRGETRFVAVVEEAVLRYQLGDADAMAGQLGYLLTLVSKPNVSLGVIPFSARARHMWTMETFTIYGTEQVLVELLSANVTLTAPTERDLYERAFLEYAKLAVYGAKTRALITAAIEALT